MQGLRGAVEEGFHPGPVLLRLPGGLLLQGDPGQHQPVLRDRLVLARIALQQQAARQSQQDWAGVKALLDGAPKALHETPDYVLMWAELEKVSGNPAKAVKRLEQARDKNPTEV